MGARASRPPFVDGVLRRAGKRPALPATRWCPPKCLPAPQSLRAVRSYFALDSPKAPWYSGIQE